MIRIVIVPRRDRLLHIWNITDSKIYPVARGDHRRTNIINFHLRYRPFEYVIKQISEMSVTSL